MNRKTSGIVGLLVAYTVLVLGLGAYDTVIHEDTHALIFSWDGCENVTTDYINGVTSCHDDAYFFNDWSISAQLNNEIINYNFDVLRNTILTAMLVICLTILGVSNGKKENKKPELSGVSRSGFDYYYKPGTDRTGPR
jgi:uncharacterized membrane protein